MRRFSLLLSIALLLPFTSGCILSSVIASSGKKIDHLLEEGTTGQQVRAELGQPVWRAEYPEPIPVSRIPEACAVVPESHKQEIGDVECIVAMTDEQIAFDPHASACEVYHRKGPFYDRTQATGYMMMSGFTFGLAEVYLVPAAICERLEKNKKDYYLTFWYDENDRYVGFCRGDARRANEVLVAPVSQFDSLNLPPPVDPSRN